MTLCSDIPISVRVVQTVVSVLISSCHRTQALSHLRSKHSAVRSTCVTVVTLYIMHFEQHTELDNLITMQNLRTSANKGSNDAYDVHTSLTRQGLTPPADATLVPMQARREQVARDPGPARTEVGRVCVRSVRRGANRGLSLWEGVLAKAIAVRPRATLRP